MHFTRPLSKHFPIEKYFKFIASISVLLVLGVAVLPSELETASFRFIGERFLGARASGCSAVRPLRPDVNAGAGEASDRLERTAGCERLRRCLCTGKQIK